MTVSSAIVVAGHRIAQAIEGLFSTEEVDWQEQNRLLREALGESEDLGEMVFDEDAADVGL